MASTNYGDNALRNRKNAWGGPKMYDFLYVSLTKFIHQTPSLFRHFDTFFYSTTSIGKNQLLETQPKIQLNHLHQTT